TAWPAEILQPALFTTCVGAGRALLSQGLRPEAVVGHSLGEFAALCVAGVLSYEDGLRLVFARGRAMSAAARRAAGGMAAVIGLDAASIEAVCEEIGAVWVANWNSPKQVVISGRDESLARAAEACREAGAARVVRLKVPMAGHCPLMEPAAEEFKAAIAEVEVRAPSCAFYSVVDARTHDDPEEIRDLLVSAITSPVRFADALYAMHAWGVKGFVEVGPARVLTGLARQTLSGVGLASVATDGEAEALAFSIYPMGFKNGFEADAPITIQLSEAQAVRGSA
ncbi:MAG: ACP S-malonyltransferase, partial [Acidimicrobiales bacterium]